MPLVAMRGDERVDATKHNAETWEDVKAASSRRELTMPLCGIRAVAKTRGTSTRFFAHYTAEGCDVDHGEETPQHLAMKEAIAKAIDAVPGWRAYIEYAERPRRWIVDVLAESQTAIRRRVAFEVQLSSQTPERYFERSEAYFSEGIFPVWVIPRALEWHHIKVPTIVTGFGKSSPVPEDAGELLRMEGRHNEVAAIAEDVSLGRFVGQLLSRGPAWKLGRPSDQEARWLEEERRRLAEEKAQEEREAAFEARVEAMNRSCRSPEAEYGHHMVRLDEEDAFVFATLALCWQCSTSMLLWWTRTPGRGRHWVKAPSKPDLEVDLKERRFENHPTIHRAVDAWRRAAGADVPKAPIQLRRTVAAGTEYSAFTCPSCGAVFGENFLARIKDEHWSVIAGPDLAPPQPRKPIRQWEGPVPPPLAVQQQMEAAKRGRRERGQFEGRTQQQIEADRAALEAWLAKDRASSGVSPQELARREQARIERAAEKEAFNANPQYVRFGARHICTVCGGFIDDEREAGHKGGACKDASRFRPRR